MRIDRLKIRSLMTAREITQKDLSARSGISRTSINSVCCGRSCRTETAQRIAHALGVKVEELREG